MEKVDYKHNQYCLALGFFDCMHLGHRAIFRTGKKYAEEHGLMFGAFTFSQPIKKDGENVAKQVYDFCERKMLYAECGAEKIIAYPFTDEVKNTEAREFLDGLTGNYDIAAFVCGDDYTFGKYGAGDVRLLREYCDEKGIALVIAPTIEHSGKRISSTEIKSLLSVGNLKSCAELLGEKYFIYGEVVKGRGEGHVFGIPTANVSVSADKLLPKCGVYACTADIDGRLYGAVTNVGAKPTFDDYSTTVEALIEDFDGDLYGKYIKLSFSEYLRDIRKFDTPDELVGTIKNDIKRSKSLC